jgi:hypothetical protein
VTLSDEAEAFAYAGIDGHLAAVSNQVAAEVAAAKAAAAAAAEACALAKYRRVADAATAAAKNKMDTLINGAPRSSYERKTELAALRALRELLSTNANANSSVVPVTVTPSNKVNKQIIQMSDDACLHVLLRALAAAPPPAVV